MGLLKLCQAKEDYFVVTTNVDGLFIKAGFPTNKVHGSIHKLQCSIPCERNVWDTEGLNVKIDYSTMKALDNLPLCPECGFVSRPNICMYGDTDESYESSNLRKFRFSKCTVPFLHILQQGYRPFEKYVIRDIKAYITFPFVKGEHEHYAKIYAHTMKWVSDPSEEKPIHMSGDGNFYDVDIEKLLDCCSSKHLDYPTCEFFYRDKKIKLYDIDWVCKIYNTKVILRCNENLFISSFEDLNENILNYPPCDISYLMIEIYGDLEYCTI